MFSKSWALCLSLSVKFATLFYFIRRINNFAGNSAQWTVDVAMMNLGPVSLIYFKFRVDSINAKLRLWNRFSFWRRFRVKTVQWPTHVNNGLWHLEDWYFSDITFKSFNLPHFFPLKINYYCCHKIVEGDKCLILFVFCVSKCCDNT
jgi:hypothetical protein